MFIHNFKYAFKTILKNKMLIFWTFAFPIILGTLFTLAFSNIEKNEQLDIIDIAIVDNDIFKQNNVFKETFNYLSDDKNDEKLFNIKYVSEEEAKELLKKNKISGYLLMQDEPSIIVSTSGINETIIKQVVEEINKQEKIIKNIIDKKINDYITDNPSYEFTFDYEKLYKEAYDDMMKTSSKISIQNITTNHLSYTMIEFYSLIAMTCLYGGILGMTALNSVLPNMSSNGKRVGISPIKKGRLVLSSALASFLVQLIGIVLLFVYTILALKVDYGNHFLQIILLTFIGCLAGLAFSIMVTTVFKKSENTKTGIILAFTMAGSVLAGMMGITMKYMIDKNIPLLNKINPVNMITDGFYSLYYYDTFDRFYSNLIGLGIFTALMIGISIWILRRQRYDSI